MAEKETLREAAKHRGLKLIASRRRKPGGDFGRYGLTDASGAAVMGIGGDGLTASAEDVAAYLRGAGATTWAKSASITPERVEDQREATPSPPPPRAKPKRAPPPPPPPVAPPPPPKLSIREAVAKDKAVIVAMVRSLDSEASKAGVERRFAALLAAEPMLVAERGGVVGVLVWHAIPLLQHAPLARITLLLVAQDERRQGTARALIDAALPAMAKRGCDRIELVSPIEIGGISGFLRRVGFAQTHYGFVRSLED